MDGAWDRCVHPLEKAFLALWDTLPGWRWLVLAHGACLVVNHALILLHARHPANRLLDFLRHFYPVLLYTGFYRETGVLNRMFCPDYLDPVLIGWEQQLYGLQPSVVFMEAFPYLAVSELFYLSYASYYFMIVGVGLGGSRVGVSVGTGGSVQPASSVRMIF